MEIPEGSSPATPPPSGGNNASMTRQQKGRVPDQRSQQEKENITAEPKNQAETSIEIIRTIRDTGFEDLTSRTWDMLRKSLGTPLVHITQQEEERKRQGTVKPAAGGRGGSNSGASTPAGSGTLGQSTNQWSKGNPFTRNNASQPGYYSKEPDLRDVRRIRTVVVRVEDAKEREIMAKMTGEELRAVFRDPGVVATHSIAAVQRLTSGDIRLVTIQGRRGKPLRETQTGLQGGISRRPSYRRHTG